MRSAILAAKELGIDFTMACNMDGADKEGYEEDCKTYGIKAVHVDFARNPLSKKNITAHKQLSEIIRGGGVRRSTLQYTHRRRIGQNLCT